MNKIMFFRLLVVFALLAMTTSCRKEFDDHYNSVGDASIGKNVTQVLEERGDFTLFLEMIRRADLERTLSESGLYTCIAPKDAHVQAFLDENGYTVQTMPMTTLIRYVNYHFISGMWYLYNFEKRYEYFKDDYSYRFAYSSRILYQTRGDDNNPPKYVRVFTPTYFSARAYDYKALRGIDGDDFMVEGARISKTDRDIPTSNGVIHVLEDRLPFAPRADEAMAKDPELSIMMKWFDRFVTYEFKKPTTAGQVDTTRIKHYDVATEKGSYKVLDIAEEKNYYTFIAPTDAAIRQALDQYMTPDLLGSYEEMPDRFVIQILRSLVGSSSYYGMSDITRNDPYFFTNMGTIISSQNEISAMTKASLLSSNATMFKVNAMPVIPILQSVEAGLYIKAKKYKEWQKMIENKKLDPNGVGFCGTDYNSYQHQPKTILIQPDNAVAWVNPTGNGQNGIEGFPSEYLDTLGWNLKAGIIEANVKDGNFEHKFYQTAYGYILYEDGNFIDYAGNKVPLISSDPTWTGANGSFYEVDGFFKSLLTRNTDTMEFMYRKYIEKDPQYSTLRVLIEKAEMKKTLDSYGIAFYTLFAPTDDAFAASSGYTLDDINKMTKGEAQDLLYRHMVSGRRIFTDGQTVGPIPSLSGTTLNISGGWESFQIRTQYGGATVIPERANKQASNGIVQGVSSVINQ